MQEITQVIEHTANTIVRSGFTIVGAAFCLSICIGMIRSAIKGNW